MMRRLLVALLFTATPLSAQTPQQWDSLRARVGNLESIVRNSRLSDLETQVAKLKREVGPYGDSIPPNSDFPARCPALPNGRYSIWCSVHQARLAVDEDVAAVDSMRARVAGTVVRLGMTERSIDSLKNVLAASYGPMMAPYAQGADIVIPTGRLIIGTGCMVDAAAKLQICSPDDATIHLESNLDGSQYQNSVRHTGELSLSDDGGIRLLQNGHITKNCFADTDPTNGVAFTNCKKIFDDPTREFGQFGPDSRAQWSWLVQKPGVPHEYTQDLVLRTYEDQKVITLESWRPGWTIKFAASTGFRTIDKWFGLQQQ